MGDVIVPPPAPRIVTGSYTGDGATSQTITVGFKPRILIIMGTSPGYDFNRVKAWKLDLMPGSQGVQEQDFHIYRGTGDLVELTAIGFIVYGTTDATIHLNYSGVTYHYVAFE